MPLQRSLNDRRRAGLPRALAGRTRIVCLFDAYAGLLTRRQREMLGLYYHHDLSLGEIAARRRVTRQAVFDTLRRSVGDLRSFEQRIGVVAERERWARARQALVKRLADVERQVARVATGDGDLLRVRRALRAVRGRL